VPEFLHAMVRITDPEQSRAFYDWLGFGFEREPYRVREGGSLICLVQDPDGHLTTLS